MCSAVTLRIDVAACGFINFITQASDKRIIIKQLASRWQLAWNLLHMTLHRKQGLLGSAQVCSPSFPSEHHPPPVDFEFG